MNVYLPIISVSGPDQAIPMFELIRDAVEQRHPELIWDDCLASAALDRARDMATRRYFSHINPDGKWPNDIVREHGCPIPSNYPVGGNSLESIEAGSSTAAAAFEVLGRSPAHAAHLFGLNDFYRGQRYIGIGFVEDAASVAGYYFVVIIAHLEK